MAATKEDVVSFIDNMTVLEMSEFVKELEDKYGVTAAAPAVAIAAPAAGGEAAAEEQIGSAQAAAVKEVRDQAIVIAIAAAKEVIAKKMTAAEGNALIDSAIAEVDAKLH